MFDEIPKSADSVIGEGTILGQGLIIGEQGVISPQLGEHKCYITLYANTSNHTSLTNRIGLWKVWTTAFTFMTMKKSKTVQCRYADCRNICLRFHRCYLAHRTYKHFQHNFNQYAVEEQGICIA